MTEKEMLVIKCAYAALVGSIQSYNQMDIYSNDWDGVRETIIELQDTFDFIEPVDSLGDEDEDEQQRRDEKNGLYPQHDDPCN